MKKFNNFKKICICILLLFSMIELTVLYSWGADAEVSEETPPPSPPQISAPTNNSISAKETIRGDEQISLAYTGALGNILSLVMKQFGKNVAFGSDVSNITISMTVNSANFEQLLGMFEDAANIKIIQTGPENYSVKTKAEAKTLQEAMYAEREKELSLQEKEKLLNTSLGISEKERMNREAEARLSEIKLRTFDVKFVDVSDLEKAITNVMGDDFQNLIKIKNVTEDSKRSYASVLVSAPNDDILNKVETLIRQVDKPKPMVEIEALFVEVTATDMKELGINWKIFQDQLTWKEVPAATGTPMGDLYYFDKVGSFVRNTGLSANAILKAVAENGKGRLLANPNVRTMSGHEARFASEIQEPVMSLNGDNEVRVDYKNVGISLVALPTVLDDGSIRMKINPKASAITGEKQLQGTTAPQISERSVETIITLLPNETMILSGLYYDRDTVTRTRVPILSSVPLLGNLFKSTQRSTERYSVLIYLRPRLVDVSGHALKAEDGENKLIEVWNQYRKETPDNNVKDKGLEPLRDKVNQVASSANGANMSEKTEEEQKQYIEDRLKDYVNTNSKKETEQYYNQQPVVNENNKAKKPAKNGWTPPIP